MTAVSNVVVLDTPIAQTALANLRDRTLGTQPFRKASEQVARCLSLRVASIYRGRYPQVVLAPILRAGLALEHEFRQMFYGAAVHHIGVERDEKTFVPHTYYPRRDFRIVPQNALTILLDPMNATGGSGLFGLRALKAAGATDMIFVNVIASEEGVVKIHSEFPDVVIYTVAVDPKLDENKYIVPGLGDYGDRYFGT